MCSPPIRPAGRSIDRLLSWWTASILATVILTMLAPPAKAVAQRAIVLEIDDAYANFEPAVPRAAGFLLRCSLWVISALFPQHRFMSALPPTTRREQGHAERSRINHVEAAHLGMTTWLRYKKA